MSNRLVKQYDYSMSSEELYRKFHKLNGHYKGLDHVVKGIRNLDGKSGYAEISLDVNTGIVTARWMRDFGLCKEHIQVCNVIIFFTSVPLTEKDIIYAFDSLMDWWGDQRSERGEQYTTVSFNHFVFDENGFDMYCVNEDLTDWLEGYYAY